MYTTFRGCIEVMYNLCCRSNLHTLKNNTKIRLPLHLQLASDLLPYCKAQANYTIRDSDCLVAAFYKLYYSDAKTELLINKIK